MASLTTVEDGLLGLRVRSQLRRVDDHGPAHGGDGAPPQGGEALLPEDPDEGVEHVLVVAPLLRLQVAVGGHTDECDL